MLTYRLKDLREDKDLTQKQLAKILGVKQPTYSGWENDIDYIPLTRLNNLCNYWNVTMDYMSRLSNTKNNDMMINSNIDKKTIGKRLKLIRNENKDSQEDISQIIGLARSAYSAAEGGKNFIQTTLLITFCKHYNVSMDYICGRTNNKTIK